MTWGGIKKFAIPSLDQCMFSKPNYFFLNNILYDRVIPGNQGISDEIQAYSVRVASFNNK